MLYRLKIIIDLPENQGISVITAHLIRAIIMKTIAFAEVKSALILIGVGVDLVSIERIKKVYDKHPRRFLRRILTVSEEDSFKEKGSTMAALAARYAAKEAALKAIGCGIGPAAMNEVEIVTSPGKQPQVQLHGTAARLADEKGITNIAISLSHEPPLACAFAAATGKPK